MLSLLDKIFEEFGVEFNSTESVDSFDALGYDGEIVTFKKSDYENDHTFRNDYEDDYVFKYSPKRDMPSLKTESFETNITEEKYDSICITIISSKVEVNYFKTKQNNNLKKTNLVLMVA